MGVNQVIVNGNTLIDLTGDTLASSDQLLSGITAHGRSGEIITGSLQKSSLDLSKVTVTADKLAKGITAYDSSGKLITGTASIKSSSSSVTWDPANYDFTFSGSTLKAYAYDYDSNITSWYLPNLTKMEENSCNSMKKLTKVYAPILEVYSGTSLNWNDCDNLEEVVMPKLKSIKLCGSGIYLFNDDRKLKRLVIGTDNGGEVVQVTGGTLASSGYRFYSSSVKIYVPDDLLSAYRGVNWLSEFDSSRIVGISTYPN